MGPVGFCVLSSIASTAQPRGALPPTSRCAESARWSRRARIPAAARRALLGKTFTCWEAGRRSKRPSRARESSTSSSFVDGNRRQEQDKPKRPPEKPPAASLARRHQTTFQIPRRRSRPPRQSQDSQRHYLAAYSPATAYSFLCRPLCMSCVSVARLKRPVHTGRFALMPSIPPEVWMNKSRPRP